MRLRPDDREPLKILFLGAHCDDVEIGCGATILNLRDAGINPEIRWVTFSGADERRVETQGSAKDFLGPLSSRAELQFCDFRESFFPSQHAEIKEKFESIKADFDPVLIFTHYRHDRHQDHRVISDLTWNTWRSHKILEYEIPKYDGDLGQPNIYMPATRAVANEKAAILMRHYQSQLDRSWFSPDTFTGLMRVRGVESGCDQPMAEAFYGAKVELGFTADSGPS